MDGVVNWKSKRDGSGKYGQGVKWDAEPSHDTENQLGFNLINSKDLGNNFVLVNLKITNLTDKHIDNAQAGCILKDENHAEISYEKHYVIKSDEGGLAPHASKDHVFYLYNHYGDFSKIKHILFQTESIKFK